MNDIFINYFKERQKYYKNKNNRTPILDKIINEKKLVLNFCFSNKRRRL